MREENVRSEVANSPFQTMTKFLDTPQKEYFGGLFSGIVVDNNDPDKQGKCKIRVYGIFENAIPDDHLPWALPDFSFIGSKVGSFIVPPNGAIVKVYFDSGDIYLPHYTTKAVKADSLPTQKDIDYPNNMVMFETDEGDYLTVNRKSKITTYKHNSGTIITIEKDGIVKIDCKNKLEIDSGGNMIINSKGSIDIKQATTLTVNSSTVIPSLTGPFNCLPACLYTGATHQGTISTSIIPSVSVDDNQNINPNLI